MASARSVNSWKETFRSQSRVLGENINYENQIYGLPALRKFLAGRKERLFKTMDEIDELEAEKHRYVINPPPATHMVADLETQEMVEKPTPANAHIYEDEGQWYDAGHMDKINRAEAESSVLQQEIHYCKRILKD